MLCRIHGWKQTPFHSCSFDKEQFLRLLLLKTYFSASVCFSTFSNVQTVQGLHMFFGAQIHKTSIPNCFISTFIRGWGYFLFSQISRFPCGLLSITSSSSLFSSLLFQMSDRVISSFFESSRLGSNCVAGFKSWLNYFVFILFYFISSNTLLLYNSQSITIISPSSIGSRLRQIRR